VHFLIPYLSLFAPCIPCVAWDSFYFLFCYGIFTRTILALKARLRFRGFIRKP
jgi:hypothetical protein